ITFYCNAGLFAGPFSSSPQTRSSAKIDGANAYAPAAAAGINPNGTGLPAVSYPDSVDGATGNLLIHRPTPLTQCANAPYPPPPVSCASFVATGVTDHRTITQDNDGHISWITDQFTSTDGNQHSIDLLWDNTQHFWGGNTGDSSKVEYKFPGQSAFST